MHQPIFRYSTVNSTVQYASILRINKMKLSEKIVCFWLCTVCTRSATFPSTHIIFMLYKLNHIEILSHHCYLAALCRPQSEIPHTQSHGRQMKKERKRTKKKHQHKTSTLITKITSELLLFLSIFCVYVLCNVHGTYYGRMDYDSMKYGLWMCALLHFDFLHYWNVQIFNVLVRYSPLYVVLCRSVVHSRKNAMRKKLWLNG